MQRPDELVFEGQTLRGMVHYPDTAEGPVPSVIIFHGFTGSKVDAHRIHVHIARYLEERGIAVYRYDFIGSGESDGEFEQMTLSSEIAQAHAVFAHVCEDPRCDPSQVFVIGHSMGGLVTGCFAGDTASEPSLQQPAGLILMAPAGNMIEVYEEVCRISKDWIRADGSVDHEGYVVGSGYLEDLTGHIASLPERAAAYMNDVLVIHGDQDTVVGLSVGQTFAGYYQERGTVAIIEGADHCFSQIPYEQQLLEQIGSFVTQHLQ